MLIHRMTLTLLLGIIVSGVAGAAAQVTGRVIDENGRGLPFAVATTHPAFLSHIQRQDVSVPVYRAVTDLNGEFFMPDSAAPATLWIGALGYKVVERRVTVGEKIVQVLERGSDWQSPFERMGLPVNPTIDLRHAESIPFEEDVVAPGTYELVISIAGPVCEDTGPTQAEWRGSTFIVAVSVIRGASVCTLALVERDVLIPITFHDRGLMRIRVIGRWRDTVLTVGVQ